jgi:hypothetical protein
VRTAAGGVGCEPCTCTRAGELRARNPCAG